MKIAVLTDTVSADSNAAEADNADEVSYIVNTLKQKHTVQTIVFSADLKLNLSLIKCFAPDVVFNLVESVDGQDMLSTSAPLLLESAGIPFTGNMTFATLISADKQLCKAVLQRAGIPTPTNAFCKGKTYLIKENTEHASDHLDETCFITPETAQELNAFLKKKQHDTGKSWIFEEYIDGREFNAAILGDTVLPPAEIVYANDFQGHKILTYDAKWNKNSAAYQKSVRSFDMEDDIRQALIELTRKCQEVCRLKGYARVDYRRAADGTLYVIDINTNPCISPDSGFIAMTQQFGLTKEHVVDTIIANAFV